MVPGRCLARYLAFFIAFLASLSMAPASFAVDPEAPGTDRPALDGGTPGVRPSEITGTVRINGYAADPSQMRLRAVPVGVRSSDGRQFAPDPRAATRFARLEKTDNPHVLRFSIMGLHPRTLYQLGISTPPNPVSRIFWRGPINGLALSGGPSVEIEGFAARTEVEIFDPATEQWLGMDNLQFTDPSTAVRTLRWRSSLAGVTGGELQVSTEAFPTRGAFGACDEPSRGGILYRQQVQARLGEWAEINNVNFGLILSPNRDDRDVPLSDTGPVDGIMDSGPPDMPLTPSPDAESLIDDTIYRKLLMGAPVYVRIVPQTADGPACNTETDGVHGWVILAKIPEGALETPPPAPGRIEAWYDQEYTPPYTGGPAKGHPTYRELAYKVIKKHMVPPKYPGQMTSAEFFFWAGNDPLGYALVAMGMVKPGTVLEPGQWFFYMPAGSGGGGGNFISNFTDTLGGLATGLVGAFGSALSYFSNLVEEIKNTVAEAVVDIATIVPGVGPICNALGSVGTSCEAIVKTGMEYGLTSMGMPPSIPNWEQFKDQGMDYLAAEIASEIEGKTGIPSGLTEDQLKSLAKDMAKTTIDKMTQNRGSGGIQYDWVIPYLGFDPAVWTMTVKKNDNDPLPNNFFIRTKAFGLYRDVNVHVPAKFPTNNILRIPVVLQPDTAGLGIPVCLTDRFKNVVCMPSGWVAVRPECQSGPFYTPPPYCKDSVVSTTQARCFYESWQGGGIGAPDNWKWLEWECKWSSYEGIYYRDRWIKKKFEPTACTNLWASSSTDVGGLWLPYPSPPFVDFARVRPAVGAIWDGNSYVAPGCQ